jgi:hypothetical protein
MSDWKSSKRHQEGTNAIGLDDLHVVSIEPDLKHGESGHCERVERQFTAAVEKEKEKRKQTVDKSQTVDFARLERDSCSISDSSPLRSLRCRNDVLPVLDHVKKRRFGNRLGSSRIVLQGRERRSGSEG